ncbi:Queuosine biosynthesis protein QueC [uncultured Caudovirales phage]|uniref:Queuosine biosynthesis protein QueC n=1 Tax=uncultured Caudovirales phage TaxID=2100421 RepID=A0A6J5TA19_9CAUD|nr:Queuosine biosynthesis protein QueC [uncultured Caudovirales phage]
MIIITGPEGDKQEVKIELPPQHKRIGVMVSGGADSAILLYLLALERKMSNSDHELITITVPRTDGAWDYAGPIVSFVNNLLGTSIPQPIMVGDPTLHHSDQTNSGERDARKKHNIEHIFYGSQKHPPVPMPGEYPSRPDRVEYVNNAGIVTTTCPFALLDKRHTMALYEIFQVWSLIELTHSCTAQTKGRCGECYNCVERAWALSDLGFVDPGVS